MNVLKKIIGKTTGYWLHKLSTLPVGADLFVDIYNKINYPALDVLFDVGANIGQTQYWFRSRLPKAKIYSFEPINETFHKLKQNSAGDANCILENFALGEKIGEKTISLFDDNMSVLNSLHDHIMNKSSEAKVERIQVNTLDDYCHMHHISKIDFLKIDTEGYEINVLKGAMQMMRKEAISLIYCETGFQQSNKCNTYFPELTEFLASQNYYFFGLYQVDYHDWKRGNHLANALYVHKSVFPD